MKLFHKIIGEGEPLIIMHGLFGMLDNWQTFGKAIAEQGFEVHLLDMRNHGRSPQSREFTYQDMADDLLEYMDDQRIDKAHVMGHSMGGKVAMVFAGENEDRLLSLMVIDIAPKAYPVHHQSIIEGLKALDFNVIKSRREAEETLFAHIQNKAVLMFLLKSLYWKDKGQLALRFNLDVIEENIEMVGEELFSQALYEGKTLFVRGEVSGYIKDEDWSGIIEHFPNARLETIGSAGHWVHAEKPAEFYECLSGFLKEVTSA